MPSKVKFASPFKLVPDPPVMTLLSALFDRVACAGNEVKFAPDPTKLVAVTTPAFPNLILLPTLICVEAVSYTHLTLPTIYSV